MCDDANSNLKEMRELNLMFHQEYIIMAEYRMLQTENLQGIYVIPSYENSFRKTTYQDPKAFRCISITFFGLKTLEKINDSHFSGKIKVSKIHRCTPNQHAYREGTSIETPLHNLTLRIERSLDIKEYVLGCFFNIKVWFGVIFVRSGCYEGGMFRFTLTLPEKFPNDEVPVLQFTSHLYHPAVDVNTGVLNLGEVFPVWDRKQNHIWQILKYLHWIFYNLNIKVPANMEALNSYKTNKKLFTEKVKECVTASIDHIYDDPPTEDKHYITFKPYESEIHDTARNIMLKPPKDTDGVTQGLSWVQPGSYQPFSKEETT